MKTSIVTIWRSVIVLLLPLLFAACGGGSSGGGIDTGPPVGYIELITQRYVGGFPGETVHMRVDVRDLAAGESFIGFTFNPDADWPASIIVNSTDCQPGVGTAYCKIWSFSIGASTNIGVYDFEVNTVGETGPISNAAGQIIVRDSPGAGEYTVSGTVTGLRDILQLHELSEPSYITEDLVIDGNFILRRLYLDGEPYHVTIQRQPPGQTCTVANESGTINGANVTDIVVTCVNNAQSWTHPAGLNDHISVANYNANSPRAAMDSDGNTVVAWAQLDGSGLHRIYKSEYRSGSWTHPADISDAISPPGQPASDPQVAMDNNGNAMIIWKQFDGSMDCFGPCSQIYLSEYRNDSWTHPASLADHISPVGSHAASNAVPSVAMDDRQNALIVWQQYDDGTLCIARACQQIFMSVYRDGGWTHPASLADNISPDDSDAVNPRVAMGKQLRAVVVWSQFDGSFSRIYMSERRHGAWIHPGSLTAAISPDGAHAAFPDVATDDVDIVGNDRAMITWQQTHPVSGWRQIYKSEYRNGNWTHPAGHDEHISLNMSHADFPHVAMNNNGEAIIGWEQQGDNYSNWHIYLSEYRNGSWAHPANLGADAVSPPGSNAFSNQLAMDNNGNAIITWTQSDDNTVYQAFMSEYRNGTWTHPGSRADNISPDGSAIGYPSVAMSDHGEAIIVWEQGTNGNFGAIFKSEYR